MKPVTSIEQIRENCETLFAYRRSSDQRETDYFRRLIKRGTCFLPIYIDGELAFFPSRFIGYSGNSMAKHSAASAANAIDGRKTNEYITPLLNKRRPEENPALEEKYRSFCEKYDIDFHFRVRRKYWPIDKRIGENKDSFENDSVADILTIKNDTSIPETEKQRLIAARIGQGDFRKALIEEWRSCAVTGCSNLELLRASHIKPWKLSSNKERLDPHNGLLLIPNLDTAFDRYMITFSETGKIIISKRMSAADRKTLGLTTELKLRVTVSAKRKKYLSHHRTKFNEEQSLI